MSMTSTAPLDIRTVPFTTADGHTLNLLHVRGEKQPVKGPVIVVHGAGVRANLFLAPMQMNFARYLVDAGYDVWLENWRASIDFPPNEWNLDKAAIHDHPAAVNTIVEQTGAEQIKAVIHCQGSTSFMMSAVAGLVPKVRTIVSNAVSLHPVVPSFSSLKMTFALPVLKLLTDYLNPQWGLKAPTLTAKMVRLLVNLTHHECHNAVCKQVSFTYGSGFPALWRHEQLDEKIHEWIKHEFAEVPITFFEQMRRCVKEGHLVSVDGDRRLPKDFVAQAPETDARFAFFQGTKNRCFLPVSQQRTFDWFDSHRKNHHSLHILEGYSHLDVFFGKNAARDTYPLLLAELEREV